MNTLLIVLACIVLAPIALAVCGITLALICIWIWELMRSIGELFAGKLDRDSKDRPVIVPVWSIRWWQL